MALEDKSDCASQSVHATNSVVKATICAQRWHLAASLALLWAEGLHGELQRHPLSWCSMWPETAQEERSTAFPLGFQHLSRRNLTTDDWGKFQFNYVEVLLGKQDEVLYEIH